MVSQRSIFSVILAGFLMAGQFTGHVWADDDLECRDEIDQYSEQNDPDLICGDNPHDKQYITYNHKTTMCRATSCNRIAWQGECVWERGKVDSTLLCGDYDSEK